MSFQDLLEWWNLIYAAPLAVSLVWIVATMLSGAHGGEGHGHGGHDVGHGGHDVAHGIGHAAHEISHALHHGHDTGHAGDAAHGHSHDHSHDRDHDAHRGGEREGSLTSVVFAVLGIGRVPITLLVGLALLCWGAFGLVINSFYPGMAKHPMLYIWPSIGTTFLVSFVFTRSLAGVIGRLMPKTETFGVSRFELVGSMGKTVFSTGDSSGTIDVRDIYGTVHRVQAKAEEGRESIPAGKEVMVLDFDEEDKRYIVRISDL